MSVNYSACAGIGFELTEQNLRDLKIDEEDVYETIERLENENQNIEFSEYGNEWDNMITYCLFAKDPIYGVDDFLKDLNKIGFKKKKEDLKFIREILIL